MIQLWNSLDKNVFTPHLLIPGIGPLGDKAKDMGIQVNYLRIPRIRPDNILKILKTLFKIMTICIKNDIDIIHSYTPRNNIVSTIVGKLLRVPVIWHERNMIFGKERDISKRFIALPDAVICNSDAVAARFIKQGRIPLKVRTIVNGVDTVRFHPGKGKSTLKDKYDLQKYKVVGLLSNLGYRKQPENLIKICPDVLTAVPNTKFLIVGGEFGIEDRGRKEELEMIAETMGLAGHVIFTGFMNNVEEIIRLFDLGVAVTDKEACSRAILEMMSTGIPVVAFNTGGNPELIKNNKTGILIETGNGHELANAIIKLLSDNTKRKLMGTNARERVKENFKISINAVKTTNLYMEMIK